jgi:hypothetical protein
MRDGQQDRLLYIDRNDLMIATFILVEMAERFRAHGREGGGNHNFHNNLDSRGDHRHHHHQDHGYCFDNKHHYNKTMSYRSRSREQMEDNSTPYRRR